MKLCLDVHQGDVQNPVQRVQCHSRKSTVVLEKTSVFVFKTIFYFPFVFVSAPTVPGDKTPDKG